MKTQTKIKRNTFKGRVLAFWSQVKISTPDKCWEWQGDRRDAGYGSFAMQVGSRYCRTASRIAYFIAHGPIPDDIFVCHRCDNPPCCNPHHLFLGTRQDNIDDMVRKGRQGTVKGHSRERKYSHNYRCLTRSEVATIKRKRLDGATARTLAAEYGVCLSTIVHIGNGRRWANVQPEVQSTP